MRDLELRRSKLFDLMENNSVAIVYAGKPKISSEDEFYPFNVNKNFFYLTGICQENSILLLVKGLADNKKYLFIDEYNPVKEKWTGKRLSNDEAAKISNISNVYTLDNFDSILELALDNTYGEIKNLYLDLSNELKIGDSYSTQNFANDLKEKYPKLEIKNIYPSLVKLRMIKTEDEINNIKEAINLTHDGMNDLLLNMKVGMKEYALSDRFEQYGKSHGRAKLSFSTIVGSGKNATVLHHPYEQQNETIGSDDMVLFDLGFQHNGYSADISRTYPINGTFTEKQRLVYEAVLNCNKAVIEYARKGLTIKDLQDYAVDILRNEAIRLGLMSDNDDIKKYYYHNVSHHLGLDTHDVSFREQPLEAGNVITVEPGLYFEELGIGVRIEDDVLITEDKNVVLSSDIKKEIDDIEQIFKTRG